MNYGDLDDEGVRGELPSGPTFEDLAIDDSLSDVDRVSKYVCSNIALQRVMHVKMLQETATAIGFPATCERLIPLLEPLVNDVEYVVRQHVAFQLPPLCHFLVTAGGDAGYRVLLELMVPLVARLVSDEQHDVRAAASDSLVEMAALVKSEDQGQYVLTIVLPLAHDDDNEQLRISAVALYNGLAQYFGPELCQQFCVPELISLSEDPVFRVRKSTAQSFSNVCKIAGEELSRERLVPSFQKLARDDIWGVRKACAECLVGIAHALAPGDRGPLLIPLFQAFVSDSSRWVRMAAFQNLGPFIAALEREHVTDELVDHFLSMASAASTQLGGSGEADIKFHCAYSFPAIVTILGAPGWPKLAPTFELLSADTFWKVRRTFAYSLHELARILGQDATEAQLATAFDSYLHDVQDVKLGAMMHFADFLEHVSPSFRESYLPVLTEFNTPENATKWRFREVISQQLAQLCQIFTVEATFAVVYPLVLKLVTDSVAVVRQASYHACPLLIARLCANPEWLAAVVEKFVALASSRHFSDRQTYLHICESFLGAPAPAAPTTATVEDDATADSDSPSANADTPAVRDEKRAFFSTHLAPAFFSLAADPVSNVRVVFAELVLRHRVFLTEKESCPDAIKELLSAHEFAVVEELLAALAPAPAPAKAAASLQAPASEEATSPDDLSAAAAAVLEPDVTTAPASVGVDSADVVLSLEEGTSGDARAAPSAARDVDPVA
ncbi:hypothetical protein PybrP1_004679 [[Pythium] brassicae (nom. inval.)]|nr:hypothetical protein PybrP1_004679 [[Pythium] brassicae (nom. inval.)]